MKPPSRRRRRVRRSGPIHQTEPLAPPPLTDNAMDVTELVARARLGDRSAWSTLLERYLPLIRAVARGYNGAGQVDAYAARMENAADAYARVTVGKRNVIP